MTYAILGALGFFLLFGGVIWLGFRSAKRAGHLEAQNELLTKGAEKERKADEILARPPADPDAVIRYLRNEDNKSP